MVPSWLIAAAPAAWGVVHGLEVLEPPLGGVEGDEPGDGGAVLVVLQVLVGGDGLGGLPPVLVEHAAEHVGVTWARTGAVTPMYASPETRDAALAASAATPAARLRADAEAASDRLTDAIETLPEHAWAAEVRTAQGRTVPASEVPWMRCREVWVHAVDLDAGSRFDDVPEDVLVALIEDAQRVWQRRDQSPPVLFTAGHRSWGAGSHIVSGMLPNLVARITGRAGSTAGEDSHLELPLWL